MIGNYLRKPDKFCIVHIPFYEFEHYMSMDLQGYNELLAGLMGPLIAFHGKRNELIVSHFTHIVCIIVRLSSF